MSAWCTFFRKSFYSSLPSHDQALIAKHIHLRWSTTDILSFRSLRKWWLDRRYRRPGDDDATLPQWENDYWLHQEPEFRMFYEYLDMGKKRTLSSYERDQGSDLVPRASNKRS
jgi:hypothetical protein